MFKRNTMYLFDPYWDEKSKTWNAYCSRSEFDFPAKSSYESLFFRMLVLPFNKLPITYKVHVKRFKKSKSYLFLIHLEKRRAFLKTKKPLLYFVLLFCFCMINIIGTLYKFSHNLSVHTFAKKQYIILRDGEARLQGHSLKKKIFLCSIGSQNSNIFLKQLSRKQVKAIQCVAVGEFIRKLLFTLLT